MGIKLAMKRIFDVIISLVVLVVGAPVFAIVAILVKLSSTGTKFFVKDRTGKHGRTLRM